MKKLFLALGVIALLIVVSACDIFIEKKHSFNEVLDSISVQFQKDEDADSITGHLTLPRKSDLDASATLSWNSSNKVIIDDMGNVVRPKYDTVVIMVVTLTIGNKTGDKSFDFNVIGTTVFHEVIFNAEGKETIIRVEEGYAILLQTNPALEGFVFYEWYLEETCINKFDFNTIIRQDISLYKCELKEITLSFESNGGSEVFGIKQNHMTNILEPNEPTKLGYSFDAWYLDEELTLLFVFDTMPDEDTVIYAGWNINKYTISFDSNGGSSIMPIIKEYLSEILAPNNPELKGALFEGWFLDAELTQEFIFSVMTHEDITLYAKWSTSSIYEEYYRGAGHLYGDALMVFLRQLITTGFTGVSYGETRYILDDTDQDPNNPGNVILVYLGTSVSGVWNAGNTWNREHVWPQSRLDEEAKNPRTNSASDLHSLKPANPAENSSRGKKYFDDSGASGSYEPRDEVKGDVARILFYKVVMYEHLELVNSAPEIHQMGKLDTLLRWHLLDPVDDFEMNRNEIIFIHQNNRNPFIDHPEFVEKIWGVITLSNKQTLNIYEISLPFIIYEYSFNIEFILPKNQRHMDKQQSL